MTTSTQLPIDWWQSFFDDDYAHIWSDVFTEAETKSQAEALWALLNLHAGSRVLDAGCGYGRLARPLAECGAIVTGVDQSAELLAIAERNRGDLSQARLCYIRHDLRNRLPTTDFEAAFNVFTGIGFGTEADDLAIITTLHDAVLPGSPVFIEAIQRDAVAAFYSRGGTIARRRPDDVLVLEECTYDPILGRLDGTWYWAGAGSSGKKSASMRIYTIGELIRLIESAGLRLQGTYLGISTQPFKAEGPSMGGRIGLLGKRPS